jgi:hypothetical protein
MQRTTLLINKKKKKKKKKRVNKRRGQLPVIEIFKLTFLNRSNVNRDSTHFTPEIDQDQTPGWFNTINLNTNSV